MSPRDKMRQLGKTSKPVTPRGGAPAAAPAAASAGPNAAEAKAAEMEKQLEDAMNDPAAAAMAAKKQLEELAASDPDAAKALEMARKAEEMAQKIKDDPKAAALAAAEAIKNIKPPTAEELKASAEAARKEAEETKAAAMKLYQQMMDDKPPPCMPMADVGQRMERYVDLLIGLIPEGKVPPAIEPLRPKVIMAIQIFSTAFGWVAWIVRWIVRIWNMLPFNITQMIFGAALCYFGGTFTTSIAAAEAFRTMGGAKAKADIDAVIVQLKPAWEANAKDDEVDDDGDGISDVDQLTPPQLMQRKAFILVTTVKEPQKIQEAIGSVYAAFLAVIATLKLEFAETTAMAMGVADMCKKPLLKFLVPVLEKALPPATHQWITPAIDSTMRILAVSIAWYLQQIVSAFYSALRGGKLFASGLFNIIAEKAKKGIILCPGVVGADFDPDDSIMDELIGWILAFQGFMFQINTGFTLPFPFNLIFFPLSVIEWYLRFQISSDVVTSRRLFDADELGSSACDEACCIAARWTNASALDVGLS